MYYNNIRPRPVRHEIEYNIGRRGHRLRGEGGDGGGGGLIPYSVIGWKVDEYSTRLQHFTSAADCR